MDYGKKKKLDVVNYPTRAVLNMMIGVDGAVS